MPYTAIQLCLPAHFSSALFLNTSPPSCEFSVYFPEYCFSPLSRLSSDKWKYFREKASNDFLRENHSMPNISFPGVSGLKQGLCAAAFSPLRNGADSRLPGIGDMVKGY